MSDKISDKELEKKRYNKKENLILLKNKFENHDELYGIKSIPLYLRYPISLYEDYIKKCVSSEHKVLELGSGVGTHSESILKSGANVIFSDISKVSLSVLNKKFHSKYTNFEIFESDIERIKLPDNSIDIICSAGSISYGNNTIVMKEILRLLKPKGILIMVDSLNDNPIYYLNRWINYLLGNRTKSTIKNMFNIKKIHDYRKHFEIKELAFFGSLLWTVPFLRLFLNDYNINKIIKKTDNMINVKKSAFKFSLIMVKK